MALRSLIAHCHTLSLGLMAACLPLSAAQTPTFAPLTADYVAEGAGASHTVGYFFLDIDTNGDGIPDFAQTKDSDDLDGDGIVNQLDDDDDGDGIPDIDDRAGYFQADGPAAGEAPTAMPARLFAHGETAAAAGLHVDDYWQFVPNHFYEQTGAPYRDGNGRSFSGVFQHPGAYLYVDRNRNTVPDALETDAEANTKMPPLTVDRHFLGGDGLTGAEAPGLLGLWQGQLTGETLFYQCDDDGGTGHTGAFTAYNPYVQSGLMPEILDADGRTDSIPDYPLYFTTNPVSPAIPNSLKEKDARGVDRWRYRRLGATISSAREIVLFAAVFYPATGHQVNVYYSKTDFNQNTRRMAYGTIPSTSGHNYGGGNCDRTNWFPEFRNLNDHNYLAECYFGDGTRWHDIADFPDDPNRLPQAHNPANQAWVDQWANLSYQNQVVNYISTAKWFNWTSVDARPVIAARYGYDLAENDRSFAIRYHNNRAPQMVTHAFSIVGDAGVTRGLIVGIEDLPVRSDNDFEDVVLVLNRPLAAH